MSENGFVARISNIETRVVDDATIIHNLDNATVVQLNPVAATILNGLKEREGSPVFISDLLGDIKQKYDVDGISVDALIADINRTLDSFVENGLLLRNDCKYDH